MKLIRTLFFLTCLNEDKNCCESDDSKGGVDDVHGKGKTTNRPKADINDCQDQQRK